MKLVAPATVLTALINSALGSPLDSASVDFDYSYESDDSGPGTDYVGISSLAAHTIQYRHGGASSVHKMIRDLICGKLHDTGIPGCSERPSHVKDMLRNYGCSCYPWQRDDIPTQTRDHVRSWHMGKYGKPLDELDKACSELMAAYNCISQDGDAGLMIPFRPDHHNLESNDCGIYTTFVFHVSDEGEIVCGPTSNPDYENGIEPREECRFAVCQIERYFSYKAFEIIGKDISDYVDANVEKYMAIEKGLCIPEGVGLVPDSCCGEYPNRWPFPSAAKECCDDGIARQFGDCT